VYKSSLVVNVPQTTFFVFGLQDFHYAHQGTQAVQSVMEHALLKTLWKAVMEKVSF
jgi:hypothetical protein